MIPEQVIEDIKARSELVAVVEQYVRLDKRSGSNFFGLCPFHAEDTPSKTFDLASDLAAITHGHPTGQLAAGVLAVVVLRLISGTRIEDALDVARRLG